MGGLVGGIAGAVGFIAALPLAFSPLAGTLPLPAVLLVGLLLAAILYLILSYLILPSIPFR